MLPSSGDVSLRPNNDLYAETLRYIKIEYLTKSWPEETDMMKEKRAVIWKVDF